MESVAASSLPGTAMANLTIDIDLPEAVTITGYHRLPEAHGIEVSWPMPEACCCPRCKTVEPARLESNLDVGKTRVVRDLDIFGQPAFFCYQAVFHRCGRCHHRHDLLPPFKRKDTSYTYRFEKQVLRMLIGSNEAEVARRLGISADTVRFIVKNQLADGHALTIDPKRVITDIGMDEISLKKRHKLYVTIMTDLSDPHNPQVLAVMAGRDEKAAAACLNLLTPEQRERVLRYRVDMGASYNKACRALLKNAKAVIDRFHVAKLFGEAVDGVRKKNHEGLQEETIEGPAEGVSFADVGISAQSVEPDGGGESEVGSVVRDVAGVAEVARVAFGVQEDLRRDAGSPGGGVGADRMDHEVAGSVSGDGRGLREDVRTLAGGDLELL
jgi:transposase